MSEPPDHATDEEPVARLDRLLHDLDVANDTHLVHPGPTWPDDAAALPRPDPDGTDGVTGRRPR